MSLPINATGTVGPENWAPVGACTLPTSQWPLRLAEWDDLFSAALRAVGSQPASPLRARLVLAGDEALPDRVRRLADAETACCSFFTFAVTPLPRNAAGEDQTAVALDVEVPAAHGGVLKGLVERAERARRAAA